MTTTLPKALVITYALLSAPLWAQSLRIVDHDDPSMDLSGTTIEAVGDAQDTEVVVDLKAKSLSGADIAVRSRRYVLSAPYGTENTYCWTVCFAGWEAGDDCFVSPTQEAVVPAGSVSTTLCSVHHFPNGTEGTALYRFVLYDAANANDSAWVDVEFTIGGSQATDECFLLADVQERKPIVPEITLAPNPVVGDRVFVSFSQAMTSFSDALVVYDALGARLATQPLKGSVGKAELPLGDLGSGIYSIGLERNGSLLASQRLVLVH
jgi:hypothetical protein